MVQSNKVTSVCKAHIMNNEKKMTFTVVNSENIENPQSIQQCGQGNEMSVKFSHS